MMIIRTTTDINLIEDSAILVLEVIVLEGER